MTGLLAYLNHRFMRLPITIGVMAIALLFSLAMVGLDAVGIAHGLRQYEESFLRSIDFSDVLMQSMLSFLLFAGALHVDLRGLKTYRWQVAAIALLGTSMSTVVVGVGMWLVLPLVHVVIAFMAPILVAGAVAVVLTLGARWPCPIKRAVTSPIWMLGGNRSVGQSVSRSVGQSVSRSVGQSVSRSVGQSVSDQK